MIRHNWFYKLLALAVAVVLWVYVNAERNPHARRVFTVPLEIRNLAKGYVAEVRSKGASVIEVRVTVEGLKSTVDGIRQEDVKAWIDLAGFEPNGPRSRTVNKQVSGVAADEVEVSCSPQTVDVTIESVSRKQLPVEAKFLSAPPVGYAYSGPTITPASVSISGKSASVGAVKRLVVTVPSQDPEKPVDGYFKVAALGSNGSPVAGVRLSPDMVRVKVELVEVPVTKTVVVSYNLTGKPKYPAKIADVSVSPPSVTLRGRPTALMELGTVFTEAVSVDGADSSFTREVGLRLPQGVEAVGAKRVRVRVDIQKPEQPGEANER